jgi:predicted dehydrogenase
MRAEGPVRLLVVGAGSRGTAYADYVLRRPREGRVVAVAEPRPAYRARLARRHGLSPERCFSDWREAVRQPLGVDAALIATPDRDHLRPAVALAGHGCALLVEKPLAATPEDCLRIVEAVEQAGVVCAVAYVLRYTAYTRLVVDLVRGGAIGDVVGIEHLEPIGHWHHAHAYVRGNWAREHASSPLLLAKACHDIDWVGHLAGTRCVAVSSFGALTHFRPQERPPGAAGRCLDCAVEPDCPFSAVRLYLGRAERGERGWPVDVVAEPPTPEAVRQALRDGPYGRCVYAAGNDVVDHQVVTLRYESGASATITVTAFARMRDRVTRVFGTRGELHGDGRTVEVYDFLTDRTTRRDTGIESEGGISTGHGGGDDELMAAFLAAVAARDPGAVPTTARRALTSHLLAFAAETSRREGRVVVPERDER